MNYLFSIDALILLGISIGAQNMVKTWSDKRQRSLAFACVNQPVEIAQVNNETTSVGDMWRAFVKVITAMLRNRTEHKHEGWIRSCQTLNRMRLCIRFPFKSNRPYIHHAPTLTEQPAEEPPLVVSPRKLAV